MTGLTSCCRKRTYGPPLLPGGLFQRRLPKRSSVKNDADCRPSIYGWRSSWAGTCWLTGCSQWLRLRSHVSNFVRCCSTRQPGAAKRIPMKKKYTVDLHTKQSRHGGSNAKSGWCTKCQCEPLVQDCKGFLRIPGQGRGCSCWGRGIQGILRKEVADKRGHLPAQATTTLAWCERSAWGRRCRSGHEGHLIFTWMAWMTTTWWKRCYEELRGARFVSPFLRIFIDRFGGCWVVLCLFVFVCLFVCFLFFFWVKFCIQLAFHIFGRFPVVDRPCPVLARQCRKKKSYAHSTEATDCVSSFSPFGHPFLQRSGWASLFAGEEHLKGIWVSARCMPSSLVSRGLTKPWVGQVVLRSPTNRHALDLTFHWTIKATRNEIFYWVHGAPSWSAFNPRLRFPPYGFLATGSPRLTAF